MKILFIVLFILWLGTSLQVLHGTAYVSGVAELKCGFHNPENLRFDKLRFDWRIGNKVVYAMEYGEEKKDNVNDNYKYRTIIIQTNGDLKMYNITFHDKQEYICDVFKKTDWTNCIHQSSFRLNVLANFSKPEIDTNSSSLDVEKGETVTLRCSAGLGFPEPHRMFWKVSAGNKTETVYPTDKDITNSSTTFNISSSLSLKVEQNTNITCVLEAHHSATSRILQIEINNNTVPTTEPGAKNAIISVIACGIIVILAAIFAIIFVKRRLSRRSQNNGDAEIQNGNKDPKDQAELFPLTGLQIEMANGSS
ncbi:T-lymphocyte activation antigen CD86 isoform X2 [Mixophyes fleayi]|uniref:T-lymphocyte activation antigen CD86 isoform X2 n=1 Tax=Mixophyes fleayi TaxID=3061075 RepID=UPI003F4DA58F